MAQSPTPVERGYEISNISQFNCHKTNELGQGAVRMCSRPERGLLLTTGFVAQSTDLLRG